MQQDCDYDKALELASQARKMGAVEVSVGGLTVRWAGPPDRVPALPDAVRGQMDAKTPLEIQLGLDLPETSLDEDDPEFESILYHSAG